MAKIKDYNLMETPFANIFLNLNAFKLTGWIEVTKDSILKRIFVEEGTPVYASSTDEEDKIGMVLVSQGKLSHQQLKTALQKQVPGKKLGAILVALSYVSLEDLQWAINAQAKQIITSLFNWGEGMASIYQNKIPDDIIKLSINIERTIIGGIRSITNPRIILVGLGSMDARVKFTHIPPDKLKLFQLTQNEQDLIRLLQEKELSVRQICQINKRPAWETCQLLYLLLAIGCLIPA